MLARSLPLLCFSLSFVSPLFNTTTTIGSVAPDPNRYHQLCPLWKTEERRLSAHLLMSVVNTKCRSRFPQSVCFCFGQCTLLHHQPDFVEMIAHPRWKMQGRFTPARSEIQFHSLIKKVPSHLDTTKVSLKGDTPFQASCIGVSKRNPFRNQ